MSESLLYAIEAEQSVIGALLRDNDAIDRLGELRPAHFYRDDHRVIVTEILRQIQDRQPCDVVTVGLALTHLPDILPYLNTLTQAVPSAANVARYAELVMDRALRRAMLSAMDEVNGLVHSPLQQDARALLDQALGKLQALALTTMRKEPLPISQVLVQHAALMQERAEGKVMGLQFGFRDLDALFPAGLGPGKFVVVAGRPSMGKSALAFNVLQHNAAAGVPGMAFSMEMENYELVDRLLAQMAKVPLHNVMTANMSQFQWDAYATATARLAGMPLAMDDEPALTLRAVCHKARVIKRKQGLKLLAVDYLQLMAGDGDPKKSRNQQIEEISRGLKALAKELGIVVVALAQLNRNAANVARPRLADLRDSGAIEQDADVVIFVHRDEVDNPQTHLKGFADVFVAKHRGGELGDVLLAYEGRYTLFRDADGPRPLDPTRQEKRLPSTSFVSYKQHSR